MIQLPKKLFYALEAVLYIAYNGAHTCISSKEIAQKQNMPPRYLEQIMQRLVREGVLKGVRGPNGGYLLAREKRRITLADIAKAVGEEEEIPSSTPLGDKVILPVVKSLQHHIAGQMAEITINDLYQQAGTLNIRKASDERNDFEI